MNDDRAAELAAIAAQIAACTRCDLYKGAKNPVPGAGDPFSEILLIGEGPGFYEDQKGLPFVGRSGDYLEKLLALIGLKREQVFISNVVKHRPPENRDPLPHELAACKPYMDEQEALIDPLIIVTLGRYSMGRYFPGGKITQIHGKPKFDERCAYYPLFHPAAVLRNPGLEPEMAADFRRIPEVIAEVKRRRANPDAANDQGVGAGLASPAQSQNTISPPAAGEPESSPRDDKPTQMKLF
jgi:DNA polymerase